MRKKTSIVLLLALALVAFALTGCESIQPPESAPKAAIAGSISFSQQNTGIWVNGQGKVTVTPDVAILSLGIESQEASVATAQAQAATAMTAVINALKANGVAEKDIRTSSFSISKIARWDESKQQEVVLGYRVSNMVTAKVRKVAEAGAVIDAVAQAGGNLTRINGISFTIDDPARYNAEAREKAMADAEAKAKQLANLGGVKLGKPTYIQESGGYVPYQERFNMPVPAPLPAGAVPTPISPGETEVQINVQVVYSIL